MNSLCGAIMSFITDCSGKENDETKMDIDDDDLPVDEKLYSRQLYVMGHEAQRRMMSSHILLVGLSGLGLETAKNIILAGVSSLTIADSETLTWYDLCGHFYAKEEDVGKPRVDVGVAALAALNRYVKVKTEKVSSIPDEMTKELTKMIKGKSCVVVCATLPLSTLYTLNEVCRKENSVFIVTRTHGVFGSIFCDFGEKFVVNDKDGENPISCQIESILTSNPALVKVLEDQGRHGFDNGDFVTFDRVVGLEGLIKEKVEYEVKVTGPYTFELVGCDCSSGETPATQGYITQVKKPVNVSFRPLKECMEEVKDEELMLVDFAKMERPKLLHFAFTALSDYVEKNGYPEPGDKAAAQKVYEMALQLGVDKGDDTSKTIIYHLASGSKSILSPMCASLGGIVAQEVLKACSGKFMPIKQFLYLDADECLPEEILPKEELTPDKTTRYQSQVSIFGKSTQDKILNLNYFLVGAGAIGCEMLKNWACMGVACGPKGHVHITDMDRIEKSNLSRQFLFRNTDIDSFKSTTAARVAKEMNPSLSITAYQDKVGAETENIFGDSFYDSLSGVCTALDNVEARLYMDQKCLFYRLPMLESGTLGTKGNTQVVVPHLTENYGATRDPPEKSIPVCTLKNFPNQIQHTLQWARDFFEGVFKQSADDVNAYLTNPEYEATILSSSSNPHQKLETVRNIRKTLVDERPGSFQDCIIWARLLFEQLFNNQIQQLLHNFPPDQLTSTGTKFWSGSKRCPKPVTFDINHLCDDAKMRNHYDFIVAAANLRAHMFGIKGSNDESVFRSVLKDVMVPEFSPKEGVKIAVTDQESQDIQDAEDVDINTECRDVLKHLPSTKEMSGFSLHPIEFDKDIDEHMLFVTACSNLRALNYSIPTEDTHRSRAIAGRIIPAIATTTALVTGLICLELYKIVGSARKGKPIIEDYKNAFVNLAIPFMTLSEPTAPAKTKAILKGKEWEWTAWDSLDLNKGDITLAEFMEYMKTEYNLEVSMISQGVSILYSFFANKKKVEERMKMKMSDVVRTVGKKELPTSQNYIVLEIIANDLDTDEEVELPYVKFKFR